MLLVWPSDPPRITSVNLSNAGEPRNQVAPKIHKDGQTYMGDCNYTDLELVNAFFRVYFVFLLFFIQIRENGKMITTEGLCHS